MTGTLPGMVAAVRITAFAATVKGATSGTVKPIQLLSKVQSVLLAVSDIAIVLSTR